MILIEKSVFHGGTNDIDLIHVSVTNPF